MLFLLGLALAQAAPPGYRPLRYEEDWSVLRDPALRGDFFDPIKFIPLDAAGDAWLTLGADLREQLEYYDQQDFGTGPDRDAYLLHRFYPYADLHLGASVRAFFMLKNALAFDTQNDPFPSQQNTIDVHDAFVDVVLRPGDVAVTLRPGRQELLYGSGRLIDDRSGPNSKWTYDAARVVVERAGAFRLDALVGRPVQPDLHGFDDSGNSDIAVWGIYATFPFGLDVYWLGILREDWAFEEGTGDSRRHTVGARSFATAFGGLDWNVEAAVQVGRFDDGRLLAWALNADVGWIFRELPGVPRVGCRFDVHSGDRQAGDGELETFDPFFPRGILQGEAGSFGPANLTAVTPEIVVAPGDYYISARWSFYWRQSLEDGLYSLNLFPYASAGAGDERFIGRELSLTLGRAVGRHVYLYSVFSYTETGPVLEDAGYLENQAFASATLAVRF